MDDWTSWASRALADAPSFDEMALRVAGLPRYRGIPTLDSIQTQMTEHDALVYIAHRLLGEPALRAASRRVYEGNWLVRQATVALLNATEAATVAA